MVLQCINSTDAGKDCPSCWSEESRQKIMVHMIEKKVSRELNRNIYNVLFILCGPPFESARLSVTENLLMYLTFPLHSLQIRNVLQQNRSLMGGHQTKTKGRIQYTNIF